jgi:hypothetical protein
MGIFCTNYGKFCAVFIAGPGEFGRTNLSCSVGFALLFDKTTPAMPKPSWLPRLAGARLVRDLLDRFTRSPAQVRGLLFDQNL